MSNYAYQYPYYYPQPYQQPYYYQPQPDYAGAISRTVDDFARGVSNIGRDFSDSVNRAGNDMQRSFRRMERTFNGEPEYSVPRLASWAGGATLLYSLMDSTMRNRPEGLLVLAIIGAGAFAGNWAYDWFMDRWGKQTFGW